MASSRSIGIGQTARLARSVGAHLEAVQGVLDVRECFLRPSGARLGELPFDDAVGIE